MEERKRIFSGMQPSGLITLGNYLGALKNWTNLQDDYDCLYCIVDEHAITVRQDPAKLRKQARDLLTQYLAVGIDPKKNIIYYQSHVSQHAELAWILNCFTYMGELNRMTQFKDKAAKHADNINAGLFTYPVLMAADILLYQTDLVPVGEDQRQHLEITRDIAVRFNSIYGDTFKVPEAYIGKVGARIMALQDPTKKMSKSDENKNNTIALMDEPAVIMNKVKRAVTDSDNEVRFDESKPGISNLLGIYCACTGKTIAEAEKEFDGVGYGVFKTAVGEAVVANLEPIQQKVKDLEKNKDYLDEIIKDGAQRAGRLAERTLTKVQKRVGFPPKIR
ncbi:tryptophan--tRNA ligase [Anaerotignum lactatifermentans]|uniref:Tryptophan--tRNA ligase n=1 Tax=Anaerotignum lactatifermentans TaxID=160404 RepID=A0ABS2G7N8_9FIRM|nr:tryptophan--tRNA ligase [Anaerotignum lactatifermentans]MBM6877486.1 tryptophan--tRNA ligase [Anaerotignum lactatifermentans]MBM6950852.1 tryptophan--tRNA ligase [Anaerotignum lactatifermentans]